MKYKYLWITIGLLVSLTLGGIALGITLSRKPIQGLQGPAGIKGDKGEPGLDVALESVIKSNAAFISAIKNGLKYTGDKTLDGSRYAIRFTLGLKEEDLE